MLRELQLAHALNVESSATDGEPRESSVAT
jgi:hypothetical protein